MRPVQFGPKGSRNKPAAGDRNAGDVFGSRVHIFFPAVEVDSSGIWGQHYELGEGHFGASRSQGSGVKSLRAVAGQAKNEGAEHVHAVPAEGSQLLDQVISRRIEFLINVF